MDSDRTGTPTAASVVFKRSSTALDELHTRIAHYFRRPEVKERVRRYLAGLLSQVERRNGWQMAEQMEEAGPQGAQRILNGAR